MKKFIFFASVLTLAFVPSLPQVAGMLGVSTYAAKKIVDAIMTGASIWTVVSLLIVSGGSAAVAWAAAKAFIKRFGASTAVAW